MITSEEEARLAFLGCSSLLHRDTRFALAFDIGGGSTEFMWVRIDPDQPIRSYKRHLIQDWLSLPYGVMNMSEQFGGSAYTEMYFDEIVESLVKKLEMIPVECVVRNIAAGSICRRLGVEEGLELNPPTFEFFLKNDDLGDPMVNDYHIRSFGWATDEQVAQMKTLTFQVNEVLKQLFLDGGMLLVDYKLEFGVFNGEVLLGDEFSPDGCRLWDKDTREKLDKDRFRQGLGGVVEAYEEVGRRLGMQFQY